LEKIEVFVLIFEWFIQKPGTETAPVTCSHEMRAGMVRKAACRKTEWQNRRSAGMHKAVKSAAVAGSVPDLFLIQLKKGKAWREGTHAEVI
jgi:hypothetical protein